MLTIQWKPHLLMQQRSQNSVLWCQILYKFCFTLRPPLTFSQQDWKGSSCSGKSHQDCLIGKNPFKVPMQNEKQPISKAKPREQIRRKNLPNQHSVIRKTKPHAEWTFTLGLICLMCKVLPLSYTSVRILESPISYMLWAALWQLALFN